MRNLMARTHLALTAAKSNQKGVTAIEYGLIAALIAVVVIGAYTALGGSIENTIQEIEGSISGTGGSN